MKIIKDIYLIPKKIIKRLLYLKRNKDSLLKNHGTKFFLEMS